MTFRSRLSLFLCVRSSGVSLKNDAVLRTSISCFLALRLSGTTSFPILCVRSSLLFLVSLVLIVCFRGESLTQQFFPIVRAKTRLIFLSPDFLTLAPDCCCCTYSVEVRTILRLLLLLLLLVTLARLIYNIIIIII